MANEQEYKRISNELSLQQSKGEAIREQMQAMQSAILEVASAIEAIEGLKKAKGDTLIPVGAGVFVSCPKPDPDKVVISVGAGLLVQKKPEEAIKLLTERQKRMSEAMSSAQGSLAEVVQAIEKLTAQASELAAVEEKRNVRSAKEQAD
ncbi:MAG: prefoldin subunit alpha [Candidatus Micrarchaeota archaeon]|nr:prefoldin subunit alpha [Candidatus Micrarchaeota archaeon]